MKFRIAKKRAKHILGKEMPITKGIGKKQKVLIWNYLERHPWIVNNMYVFLLYFCLTGLDPNDCDLVKVFRECSDIANPKKAKEYINSLIIKLMNK